VGVALSGAVLIRCDASPEIGLGHVVRCLALARELRDAHGRKVAFAMRAEPLGIGIVRQAGFPVVEALPDGGFDYREWMAGAAESLAADAIVLDVRDDLTLEDVRAIRLRTGAGIAVIDDASDKRLAADDVFYPPVAKVRSLSWPGFAGHVHTGWEWALLRPEFAAEPDRVHREPPTVLVSMGGSDPAGLTIKAVRALALVERPIECAVLLGSGFCHDASLAAALDGFPHRCLTVRDGDVRAQMVAADLGVLSFGVTAYEAAACALPAVHLCLTDDHALSSSAFVEAGLAVSLGLAEAVPEARVAEVVDELLADTERRRLMGEQARRLVDGKGAGRIAEVIAARRFE
jgi:spore coat polysaccharide biosynthesis protein SpsF